LIINQNLDGEDGINDAKSTADLLDMMIFQRPQMLVPSKIYFQIK